MGVDRFVRLERTLLATGALLFVLLSVVGITRFPLPWWDEGWTLSVAKNWVTTGHYGHVLNGIPAGPTLSAHLPVVMIVASAFVIFGIGLLQARMAIIVCAAIALVLLYLVTREISSRRSAIVALVLVCVFPVQWDLSVLFIGRNVLGEVPALMFILLGLYVLARSEGTRPFVLATSGVVFGIALATKAQVVPFVLFGLIGVCVLLMVRERRLGLRMCWVVLLAVAVMYAMNLIRATFLTTSGIAADPVIGLTEVTAIVLDPNIRISTLRFALFTGAPITLALAVAMVPLISRFRPVTNITWSDIIRSLLALIAGSWFAWYILLSIGWGRYGFPAFVLASPFVAELLGRLFRVLRKDMPVQNHPRLRRLIQVGAGSLLLFFCATAGRQTLIGVQSLGQPVASSGLEEVTAFVNHSLPAGSTAETYESELLFLLEIPVHVPPAQVNVELIRRDWLRGPASLNYDLSSVTADLLIVGAFGGGVYEPLISRKSYVPVARFGAYTVYRRGAKGR